MSSWLDKVKEGVKKVAEEAKEGVKKVTEEAEELAAIGKLKLDIRSLQGKREEAFRALGAKVYALYEAGAQFPPEVTALCQDANKLADEIKAKEAEITKLRAEA